MSFIYIFGVYAAFFISLLAVMILSRIIRNVTRNISDHFRFKKMIVIANGRRDENLPKRERK